jgi:hypothetical protein
MSSTNEQEPEEGKSEDYENEVFHSSDAKVPKFLKWTYILLPIWGIITLYIFWNGSTGWFDRGAWQQLQVAANTTFPTENRE